MPSPHQTIWNSSCTSNNSKSNVTSNIKIFHIAPLDHGKHQNGVHISMSVGSYPTMLCTYVHIFMCVCMYVHHSAHLPSLEVQLYILVCTLVQHMEYQPETAAESTPTAFSKVHSRWLYWTRLLKICSWWYREEGGTTVGVGPSVSRPHGCFHLTGVPLNLKRDLLHLLCEQEERPNLLQAVIFNGYGFQFLQEWSSWKKEYRCGKHWRQRLLDQVFYSPTTSDARETWQN